MDQHNIAKPRVIAVIPARYHSNRFEGKPVAPILGKPMIQHVYERALSVQLLSRVVVATDDERIALAVKAFGGDVVMTRSDHATGTDRLAEVAADLDDDLVVNVQGDEPEIAGSAIDLAIEMLEKMIRGRRRHPGKAIEHKHKELDFRLMFRDSDAPPPGHGHKD